MEDGDLQTLGFLDYEKRLTHSFTAHPKLDPITGKIYILSFTAHPKLDSNLC
jgi:carotenoid cleavage dioxygenase